ncbi:putative UDP-N-acetylenolpyruvoylglucosamine reductase [Vibrio coralliirubri]|uniref:FAD-binding protein n=1 Tax=Vibrio TaxID=662 RepID=UPI00063A3AA2|nr:MULTISPECIES: FAD-binding protein [Vibrio]PQJ57819.1 hypothetical protein BTO12_09995 [Vibrio splendidus]CDT25086.1 putative UDP-N-acetylenolpyruvoylglucosamine reductase [Vibrio coralliirubri]
MNKPVLLSKMTTLGVGGCAKNFHVIKDSDKIPHILEGYEGDVIVLGEGSNLCFSDANHDSLFIKLENKGISVISEDEHSVIVSVSSGENWDDFVKYTISNDWWGVENMSLIPGSVGACPVQNVGAYGQDCRQVIESVRVFDTNENRFSSIDSEQCKFGFRSSVFNEVRKTRYIIVSVVFKLSKIAQPCVSRPIVRRAVASCTDESLLQSVIRSEIVKERSNGVNLPNDDHLGCSGTFFRTSIVSQSQLFKVLLKTFLNLGPKTALLVAGFCWKYRSQDGCKLPSKFLINASGAANIETNSVFLYPTNPAVLTTRLEKAPTSEEILYVIKSVREIVYKKTGVKVPIEPTLIGFGDEKVNSIFEL